MAAVAGALKQNSSAVKCGKVMSEAAMKFVIDVTVDSWVQDGSTPFHNYIAKSS